jgi:hypothetical protein
MAAAKRATLERGRPDLNRPVGLFTQAQAAEQFGVSHRAVERAAVVRKRGAPELVEAAERGEIAVREAATIARKPEAAEQREVEAAKNQPAECGRRAKLDYRVGRRLPRCGAANEREMVNEILTSCG